MYLQERKNSVLSADISAIDGYLLIYQKGLDLEMKKINYIEIIVQSLIVLLFTMCLWILPLRRTPNFWISFAFSVASLVTYTYLSSWWTKKEVPSQKFLHLIYPVGSILVFLVQIAWNLFVLFVSTITLENILGISKDALLEGTPLQGAPIKAFIDIASYVTNIDVLNIKIIDVAVPVNLIVNLFCTIGYVAVIYVMFGATREIQNIDNRVRVSTSFIRNMETEIRVLAKDSLISASTQDKLNTLAEQVKYSNPMSNHFVEKIESDLRIQLDILADSVSKRDHEKTSSTISRITTLLEQRELLCKNSK